MLELLDLKDLLLLGLLLLRMGGIDIAEYFSVHYIGRRNKRWLAIGGCVTIMVMLLGFPTLERAT